MKTKFIILILSIIYSSYLLTLLAASHYKSSILNPLSSEYYFEHGFLTKAIELEPSKAEYHMYYGLELSKILPLDQFSTQTQLRLAKEEFLRATKLKLYCRVYQNICNIYVTWIDKQLL